MYIQYLTSHQYLNLLPLVYQCFPGERLSEVVGSPLYISPSVLRRNYGTEADLWSLGVVLYIMLCGIPPFWGKNNAELFYKILHCPLNLNRPSLRDLSPDGIDLLEKLLQKNPADGGITASEVLGMYPN